MLRRILPKIHALGLVVTLGLLCGSAQASGAMETVQAPSKADTIIGTVAAGLPEQGSTPSQVKEPVATSANADKPFLPASLAKLFTAVAVIDWWTTHPFRWCTTWSYAPNSATKEHEVWLEMTGDPLLTKAELARSIQTLKKHGVRRIKALHVMTPSSSAKVAYGPGWMWDELLGCHAAPITPYMLDRSCYEVTLDAHTSTRSLLPAQVTGWVLRVGEKTQGEGSSRWRRFQQDGYTVIYTPSEQPLKQPLKDRLSVRTPRHYLRQQLMAMIHDAGIRLDEIDFGEDTPAPSTAQQLRICHSNLGDYLELILDHSDNTVTEALAQKLAREKLGDGSWHSSSEAISEQLLEHNIDIQGQLVDASGLSRYDTVTPAQVGQLLKLIDQTPRLKEAIRPHLTVVGESGTTAHDFTDLAFIKGRIHAKSGSMRGVRNLAGYMEWPGCDPMMFVWLEAKLAHKASVVNTAGSVHHQDDEAMAQFFRNLYEFCQQKPVAT